MDFLYYWSKLIKKLPSSAIKNSVFEKPSKVEARSTVINASMGRYSYCGYSCTIINCQIGRYCSIADNVKIGLADHPLNWVSTSCAFYRGKDSIPKDLAKLDFHPTTQKKTIIGNDVWIGTDVIIKAGVQIGNGSVIGMGTVVTKDVPAYSIVCGVPAKVVRMRFGNEIISRLEKSEWWNLSPEEIIKFSEYINTPLVFLKKIEEFKI